MVSVPDRWFDEELAPTEYPTDPLPVPEAPDEIVIQAALLVAVQVASWGFAVTDTAPVPPALLMFVEDWFSEKLGVTPACVTLNVAPPIVSDAERWLTEVFAATA